MNKTTFIILILAHLTICQVEPPSNPPATPIIDTTPAPAPVPIKIGIPSPIPDPKIDLPPPASACGANEYYECEWSCDTKCATLGQQCSLLGFLCTNMCRCKSGFARDRNGNCIPEKKCPGNTKCPKNEVYDKKIPSCPRQKNCRTLFEDEEPCPDPIPTYASCRCRAGFIRTVGMYNNDGECVPRQSCCKEPNTVLVNYPNPCPGNTCDHPPFELCHKPTKEWGCQCRKGFVKISETNRKCIRLENC